MEQEQNEKQEIAQSATVELTTADGKKKKIKDSKYYVSTRKICYVALFTALNIVMSSSICSIPRSRRTFVLKRHSYMPCRAGAGSVVGVYSGRRGCVLRRYVVLSHPHVRISRYSRLTGGCDIAYRRKEKRACSAVEGNSRGCGRRGYNGYGLFSRKSFYILHSRICDN